jgi:hypothetical protein
MWFETAPLAGHAFAVKHYPPKKIAQPVGNAVDKYAK